ncbi:MAG: phytanoyl-CoA dioxygenase family protein [Actinomycetota bacterium]
MSSGLTSEPLNDEQITAYRDDGWIAPIDVLTEAEAAELLAELEAAEHRHPADLHAENRNNAHLVLPFLGDLAADARVVDRVAQLVGDDISLWSSVIFAKDPESAGFVSWHQDAFYMALEPANFVTAWIALTPSTRESGCVSVIPGSHRRIIEHEDTFGEDNILTRGQTVSSVDSRGAVDLVLRPGQMSLHHPWLIHGSQPNRSSFRRVGIAMQSYLGADVRPTRGDHVVAPIRGATPPEVFTTVSLPDTEMHPRSVEARRAANDAFASILYDGAERQRAF